MTKQKHRSKKQAPFRLSWGLSASSADGGIGTGQEARRWRRLQPVRVLLLASGFWLLAPFQSRRRPLMLALIVVGTGLASASEARAQVTPAFSPQYVFLSGAEYDYYGKTGFSVNSIFGARLGNSRPFYSYTTLETTAAAATLRSGIGYTFLQSGNWSAVALGDAGIFNGASASLGSFSGGGLLFYDIGSRLTKGDHHFYVAGGVRLLSIASQTVQPVGVVMLGAGF
jgi:hypothetical protein